MHHSHHSLLTIQPQTSLGQGYSFYYVFKTEIYSKAKSSLNEAFFSILFTLSNFSEQLLNEKFFFYCPVLVVETFLIISSWALDPIKRSLNAFALDCLKGELSEYFFHLKKKFFCGRICLDISCFRSKPLYIYDLFTFTNHGFQYIYLICWLLDFYKEQSIDRV